ncbi:MAG: hypothetical protein AB1345_10630 [Chloroflexota bacterium]
MPSAESDWGFICAGLPELETYLFSEELYWPLEGVNAIGQPWPRLTLGSLLLTRHRLQVRMTGVHQRVELQRWDRELETVRFRWRGAWQRKVQREIASRLRQWEAYLEEVHNDPEKQGGYFPYEVHLRVIVDLLQSELGEEGSFDISRLENLDARLKSVFLPGNFIWELDLESVFPPERFWYLWGKTEATR